MSTTPDQVIPGLEGVLACESSIAFIDGSIPELSIRGYAIKDVVSKLGFEEVVFLLWHDRVPTDSELRSFSQELANLRTLPAPVLDVLRTTPKSANPMAVLRTAVSLLGVLETNSEDVSYDSNLGHATSLTAKIPTIVAAQTRISAGEEPIAPDPSLDHAANYYYMLTGMAPDETTRRTFEATLVLYAEHETNASTFACRVVTGTRSDFYSAVVAGIGAIKGPLHGGAIDDAMRMFIEVDSPGKAASYVDDALGGKRLLPGFGHRVYRAGDPRAAELRGMAQELGKVVGEERWFDIAVACEKRMQETKGIIPNVDYYAAIVLYQLGFPLGMMTNVVASARIAGWSAHIFEQYANNRLIRPRALYTGQRGRELPAS
jgi:citrate synthase